MRGGEAGVKRVRRGGGEAGVRRWWGGGEAVVGRG